MLTACASTPPFQDAEKQKKKNQNSEMETQNKRLGGYAIETDLIHECGSAERERESESNV